MNRLDAQIILNPIPPISSQTFVPNPSSIDHSSLPVIVLRNETTEGEEDEEETPNHRWRSCPTQSCRNQANRECPFSKCQTCCLNVHCKVHSKQRRRRERDLERRNTQPVQIEREEPPPPRIETSRIITSRIVSTQSPPVQTIPIIPIPIPTVSTPLLNREPRQISSSDTPPNMLKLRIALMNEQFTSVQMKESMRLQRQLLLKGGTNLDVMNSTDPSVVIPTRRREVQKEREQTKTTIEQTKGLECCVCMKDDVELSDIIIFSSCGHWTCCTCFELLAGIYIHEFMGEKINGFGAKCPKCRIFSFKHTQLFITE